MRILFSVFLLMLSNFLHANVLDRIVVFGDSLSDNGNLYQITEHSIPSSPPYFDGRFSNGPVWVEILASSYYKENSANHLLDYAFGGASVSDIARLTSLKNQVAFYLNAHQGKANATSLYIIWMGANNYVSMPKEDINQTVAKVNRGIRSALEALIKAGGRHFMVINLPDLGFSPMPDEVVFEGRSSEQIRALLSQYCQKHNEFLFRIVNELNQIHSQVNILLFDANAEINSMLGAFKINNQSCYATRIDKPRANLTAQIASKIGLANNSEENVCEDFLFFDALHPTVKAHRIFALKVREFLTDNSIVFSSVN